MKQTSKIKTFGLKTAYDILYLLTQRVRITHLIKLKIAIGIALISAKTAIAQTVQFPNQTNKTDTLNLDIELEDDTITLCYEVVVVEYNKMEPKFFGGQMAINKFIRKNVHFPKEAQINRIEGDVAINLTIDDKGTITNADILKKKGYGLDEEALRLIKIMPKFKPGKINGHKHTMNKTIIFHFELPE